MTRLLIVRACAIGDFVLNLPALIALQKTYPNVRFTLVGNPRPLELAREFLLVENVYSIELPPWSRLFYQTVPDLEFDSAIVWMKDPTVADNLRLSGIPSVIRADPFPVFGHAADHALRTVRLERPEFPNLWSRTSEDVLVHPGSGGPKKIWPHFDALLARIPGGIELTEKNNLSLPEVAQWLRHCRAYVGNDSGITHLSAYLGCPTIALFGPTDPRIWGPVGRRARILWKRKLEDITIDEVLNALHAENTGTGIDG